MLTVYILCSLVTGTPCDQLQQFLPAAKPTLVLSLLPGSGTVYVRYGSPAPFSLNAGPSGTQNSSCGAVAWDMNAAGENVTDLTGAITIQEQSSCAEGQVGGVAGMTFISPLVVAFHRV